MDAYANLFRRVIFPAWEGLRHRPTLLRWRYLTQTQWCSTDELLAIQTGQLRRLLFHAHASVPAYRRRLDEAGLDPGNLRDVADLQKLPLLTRAEVRGDRRGPPGSFLGLQYSQDSEVWRHAARLRGYGWAGHVPGKKTVHYWGPPAQTPAGLKALKIAVDRVLRREVYLDCARQTEYHLQRAAAALRRLRPEILVGYTQATVELGRFVLQHGLRDWPAMRVLCGAERLFPRDRQVLEQAFGARGSVFETYGCRQFMLLASECEEHQGLHQSMETLVIEIVDDQGQAVPEGTIGQVVVTDLFNYAAPLIRYVTGDLATAGDPGARCSCGRGLLRLSSVDGRKQELLRGADGRSIPGRVFVALFASQGERIRQFQAIQRRDGRVDLRVVPGPEFDESVLDRVKTRLRPYLGELPLSVDLVASVPPLPSGKRQFVVVER